MDSVDFAACSADTLMPSTAVSKPELTLLIQSFSFSCTRDVAMIVLSRSLGRGVEVYGYLYSR